ncbi:MAG TPA: M15 family metallopeptidase [Treponema sp.]|nr:M15 family metallopeptidase [Treponema sp.]
MEQRPYSTGTKKLLAGFSILLVTISLYPLSSAPQIRPEIHARQVLEAYKRSYPDRVSSVSWKNDDWIIEVGGEVFYWANGRLLPEELRDKWQDFKPYVFYLYPEEAPDPKSYSPERIAELQKIGSAEHQMQGPDHHNGFRSALYGGTKRGEIEQNLVQVRFLGRIISVHRMIENQVQQIDERIRILAKSDPEVAQFLKNLGTVGGYNWREIRGTSRISMHSFGLAIDIQPRKLGSKAIYWQWEQERNPKWMLVSQNNRWAPPAAVIKAFEDEGFVWGGKWDLYDQMHFEYRPELHEVSKLYMIFSSLQKFGIGGD